MTYTGENTMLLRDNVDLYSCPASDIDMEPPPELAEHPEIEDMIEVLDDMVCKLRVLYPNNDNCRLAVYMLGHVMDKLEKARDE